MLTKYPARIFVPRSAATRDLSWRPIRIQTKAEDAGKMPASQSERKMAR